jgi:hypothetical protein
VDRLGARSDARRVSAQPGGMTGQRELPDDQPDKQDGGQRADKLDGRLTALAAQAGHDRRARRHDATRCRALRDGSMPARYAAGPRS